MKILSAIAGLLVCCQVYAAQPGEPASAEQGAWSFQFGKGEGNSRVTVNRETAPFWVHRFESSRIEVVGEFGLSYWWTNRDANPGFRTDVWQVSAIPMFRYWPTEKVFLEAGVGATAFSNTRFHDKQISTVFQFGDHIGAGYQINRNTRVGLRMSHFSNAGIKHPNPGINSLSLNVAHTF